jgi:dTDP-4-amino-4,6-dideoxygalactose transaminase
MKVPYFEPWITNDDKKNVLKSLENRWLTNGPFLSKFENKFKHFINSKHALGVGSATQALHLATRALNIGPGDEVIVPTFTFAATANSVIYCGAKVVLVDVDPQTFNISIDSIKKHISKKTKAIIPVHYGGQSCDMDKLKSLAKSKHLSIIEDCAHALGSKFGNLMCGSIGDIGCFSFYPTKIITTGEGGMVTTNNNNFNKKIRQLRSQGMDVTPNQREKSITWKYDIVDLGYNYRLDEIRSSLGLSQLNRINKINKFRIKIANQYNKLLKNVKGISIPITASNRNHIFHLYSIKIEKEFHLTRDELFQKLHKKGIGTSVQYYPLHLMSYNKNKYKVSDFPNANKLKDQVLCLPIYPTMNQKQIEYVTSSITK